MTVYRPREIAKSLHKKGFIPEERDHIYYIFMLNGRLTHIRTKLSHGSQKEYGDSLLSIMSKQLHIKKIELEKLIDCPISKEDYIKLLKERGVEL